ncbi:MAG: pyridoxamine 5'-phosphate oxidase [Burkholderiaceae bacterium]
MNLADLRKTYRLAHLDEADLAADPLVQLERWLAEALQAQLPEPNAMALATVSADGRPSCRIVLIKGLDPEGISFFTNYDSRKGRELAHNAQASVLFYWAELERQVRVEGRVDKLPEPLSDAYYQSRPLDSRLGAWASPQSRTIADRSVLDDALQAARDRCGAHPERPPHWGGYRLQADYVEFWQGRPSRLHDRLAYLREPAGGWAVQRLAP